MNFTETVAMLPITDVVSVIVERNWTEVCHHVHLYINAICEAVEAQNCIALSIGATRCFKGICICATPTTRRSATHASTEVVASVQHYGLLQNSTGWPQWMASMVVVDTDPDQTYWLLGLSCVFALLGLCAAACMVHTCKRYLGYKKLEHPKGVDPSPH